MPPRRPGPTLFPYTTLFRSGSTAALADGIRHLLHDPALRQRLTEGALRTADSRRWEEVYDQLLAEDRKSTRLNSSHSQISYAVFCLKKKTYLARHIVSVVEK